ncbi:MAG: hypothetical protein WDM70_02350 [Nitrosomonadales bacterium]
MSYYKLFYTDMPIPDGGKLPDLFMVIPLEFMSKDDALEQAFKMIFDGAIVWKIEGPEGFSLQRAEVERQYQIFRTV